MKIRILRGTICGGVPVEPGQIVEASDQDARTLVALRRADVVSEEPQAEEPPPRRGRPRKAEATA